MDIRINLNRQMLRVLKAYHGGMALTDYEAYGLAGLSIEMNGAPARCTELRRAGLIEKTGDRGFTPSGSRANLCVLTEAGQHLIDTGRLPMPAAVHGPLVPFLRQFEATYGPVGRSLSQLIRPALVARKGNLLVWGDFNNIEARINPWLAGSDAGDRKLAVFSASDADPALPDVYRQTAGELLGKDPHDVSKDERQSHGKIPELSLGFGGGVGALLNMANTYGVYLPGSTASWMVDAWRLKNPWARTFWDDLWAAVENALRQPRVEFSAGRVCYLFEPGYLQGSLFCQLPCGRLLTYPEARYEWREVENRLTKAKEMKWQLTYRKGYGRAALWYGKLCENVTQGAAGSILRAKLKRLEQVSAWMPVVAHTHDDIVVECRERDAAEAAEWLQTVMTAAEPWSRGLPLKVETTRHEWFTKALD